MITETQRTARRAYIGSSDAAAVLGLDPYKSAGDVYLDKTGADPGFAGNEATERGSLLEPVLLKWFEAKIGRPIQRDVFVTRADCDELCANLDGWLGPCDDAPGGAVVEAKTSNNPDEWGDEGTDQVPDRVIVQTHEAMWMVGRPCRVAFVPVLLPGYRSLDLRLYRVDRRDELAETIADRCRAFMRDHVIPRVPPDDFRPSLEVLRRIRRQPEKIVDLDDGLVESWIVARAARLKAEEEEAAAQAELLAALSDAEAGRYGAGMVTFLPQTRKAHQVKESTFRVLRVKGAK